MIYIDKQLDQEPESFRDWKTQHLLDNCLEKYTVGQWWDEMRKNTKVKKDLQDALLEEQGYICCYCCQEITDETTEVSLHISIEHFKEKSENKELTFEYKNLLGSCDSQGSCNLKRNKQKIMLNPLEKDLVSQVKCKRDKGFILLYSEDEQLQKDIEILNLNIIVL